MKRVFPEEKGKPSSYGGKDIWKGKDIFRQKWPGRRKVLEGQKMHTSFVLLSFQKSFFTSTLSLFFCFSQIQ